METMKLSAEQAMSAIKVSDYDRAILQKKIKICEKAPILKI